MMSFSEPQGLVDVQEGRTLYSATAQTGKHTDPVWQVRWAAAEGQRGLQFFSVSTDGRFTLWTLAKNELIHQVGPQHATSLPLLWKAASL